MHAGTRLASIAALLAMAVRCAGADEAFVNGAALYKLCDAQQRLLHNAGNELVDPESAYEAYECRYYVAGVADAMSATDPFRDCIPKAAKSDDLAAIVRDYLDRNRRLWALSGFKVVVSAIATAYRCKGAQGP